MSNEEMFIDLVIDKKPYIKNFTDEAVNGINDLMEAEKWAKMARNAGKLGDDNVLGGTHGIYSEMTWCF